MGIRKRNRQGSEAGEKRPAARQTAPPASTASGSGAVAKSRKSQGISARGPIAPQWVGPNPPAAIPGQTIAAQAMRAAGGSGGTSAGAPAAVVDLRGEVERELAIARRLRRNAVVGVMRKMREGKKLTAADYRLIDEYESSLSAAAETERQRAGAGPGQEGMKSSGGAADTHDPGVANGGATLEEDLEEYTLRDGVVRGEARRLGALALSHQVARAAAERELWRVQRRLLARYGFDSTDKTGMLTGNEALALQWVVSIGQLSRASQMWELQMEQADRDRANGHGMDMEKFTALTMTLKQICDKRDMLAIRIRELSVKEKKSGSASRRGAQNIEVVIGGLREEPKRSRRTAGARAKSTA